MENITIASNATLAKLHNPSREVKLLTQTILSYQVNGAEHSVAFKRGSWDGRSSFFDFKRGTFPAGFVHFVAASLRQKGYPVSHARKPLPLPLGPENPVVDAFGDDPRYDYQMETVRRLVKHGQIIAMLATGAGKSRVAKMAYVRLGLPTLFLTTRGILMYQMRDSFENDLGVKVSVLGDGQFGHAIVEGGIERQVVRKMSVGMVQTLISRLEEKTVDGEISKVMDARIKRELKALTALRKKLHGLSYAEVGKQSAALDARLEGEREPLKQIRANAVKKVDAHLLARQKTINLLGMFGLVILEEAHEASGSSYYEILKHCKNAHYRLALTATPFMKDSEEANMRLMACSGPIAIKVSEKTLIDRGILAAPHFKIIELKQKPPKLHRSTDWPAAYRIGIVENEFRNAAIVKECVRAAQYNLPALVLIQHMSHGEALQALLERAGVRVDFIAGEDDQDGRKRALMRLKTGEIDALIGSSILDVGVDVPAIGLIVLAGGGKAEVALRQRIGRGLRAKKEGPNVALVVDFADGFNDHMTKHARQRLAIIKGTPGFCENVLENGRDFDFAALGLIERKKAA